MGSIETIDAARKRYWAATMVKFRLARILRGPRKPDIWVFGAWHGGKYDDNSRYLFEYVNAHYPKIKAVWLSDNPEVVSEVRSLGLNAELTNSEEGRAVQRRAGFAFYTNGIDDFTPSPDMLGAEIVALWHAAIGQKDTWHMNDVSTGLIVLEPGSEVWRIIEESGCGVLAETGCYEELENVLQTVISQRSGFVADHSTGRRALDSEYSRVAAVSKYHALFNEVCK